MKCFSVFNMHKVVFTQNVTNHGFCVNPAYKLVLAMRASYHSCCKVTGDRMFAISNIASKKSTGAISFMDNVAVE